MDFQSLIADKPLNRNYGNDIDDFIKIRSTAKIDLIKSQAALLNAGVKSVKDGMLNYLPGLDVEAFVNCNNQEFFWEAEMKDGKIIRQFEGKKQNHYGNIDQSQLKFFRWISNFDYETSNEEKRIIVSLNFGEGTFEFTNGYVPQEIRGAVINGYSKSPCSPKLIMKMIKRVSNTLSYPNGEVDEIYYYNRYLLGWEEGSNKIILCVEPNGFVHLWEE